MTLLALSLLFASSTHAQVSDNCSFEVSCKDFKLQFHSSSGQCVEEDTTLSWVKNGKTTLLPVKASWFREISHYGNFKAPCKSTSYPEYPVYFEKDFALIFARQDARPGLDHILALLIDTKTGTLLEQVNLGQILLRSFGVLKTPHGYKTQLVKKAIKEMKCDCDASFEQGWLEIKIEDGKLKKSWIQ